MSLCTIERLIPRVLAAIGLMPDFNDPWESGEAQRGILLDAGHGERVLNPNEGNARQDTLHSFFKASAKPSVVQQAVLPQPPPLRGAAMASGHQAAFFATGGTPKGGTHHYSYRLSRERQGLDRQCAARA